MISLFYVIIRYELNNELIIYWINGVTKLNFVNNLISEVMYKLCQQIGNRLSGDLATQPFAYVKPWFVGPSKYTQ